MPRPCGHESLRLPPAGEPYSTEYCRICFLYATEPSYRALWDNPDADPVPGRGAYRGPAPPRCPHLHRRVREAGGKVKRRWCQTG
jgi:hypothetical protein